jgi:cardiolipin hydrolase
MDLAAIRDLLTRSLDDRKLSRNERQALATAFNDLDVESRRVVRRRAFELAGGLLSGPETGTLLEWLEAVVDLMHRAEPATNSEAFFSPGDDCVKRIIQLFDRAKQTVDACVFTITDDRISEKILAARARGVAIRILTDNDKTLDLGSDIERFEKAGIVVRVDRTSFHMHHKFAIFDAKLLLTGSYNWTRSAAEVNEENFIVTPDEHLLHSFTAQFEKLWTRLK